MRHTNNNKASRKSTNQYTKKAYLKYKATEEISRGTEIREAESEAEQTTRTVVGYLGFLLQPEQK